MFTGIIEETGRLRGITRGDRSARMTIRARIVLGDMKIGDSISVSGACLTVTAFDAVSFTADISPETLRATILGDLRPGDPVNLERAMQADGRFGGHMVTGHIDGVGVLSGKQEQGNAWVLTVSAPGEILENSVPKGSIAIDGVSLTINAVGDAFFTASIIPHTSRVTTIGQKGVGGRVNLESDLIGKYVRRILGARDETEAPEKREIDMGFLSEHGFM